jgi:molecular chaperone HscA
MEEILVIDTGGGTMDFTILQKLDTFFEVTHSEGLNDLGGNNFTKLILDDILRVNNLTDVDINKTILWNQSQKIKEKLTYLDSYEISINLNDMKINYNLTKTKFENLSNDLIKKVENTLTNIIESYKNINWVILVGGTSRIPILQKTIREITNKNPWIHPNLESVVSEGAGLYSGIIENKYQANDGVILMDVLPLSLGIETMGGLMEVLIQRNSKIPNKVAKQYTTYKDGQSGIKISVFQGERDLVKDNRKLAEFNLTGIPAMPAGLPKVEVSFLINADGILVVKAKELRSGIEQSIEVKPQLELSDSDVEKMLMDSITHAKEDIAIRALVEAKTEGEQILETTEKFIQKHSTYLTQEELIKTADAVQALQLALTMDDNDLIHFKIETLNDISRPYAERVMDEAVAVAMKGKLI